MAATPGTVERRRIHLSLQAALTIIGTIIGLIVLRGMFVKAHRPLSWVAACIVAAVLLDPIVDRLAVHIRRVPAVLLTFLAIGAVSVGTAYLVFDGIDRAVDRLDAAAPEAAARIEHRDDRVGEVASDFHLVDRVDSFVETLDDRVTGGSDVLRTTAGTAPTYLVCAILTLFLMTYGPRIARAAVEQDPDEARRRRVAEVVGPAVAKARSAILLNAALAGGVGVAASIVANALGLPAATAAGMTAGVLALLPHAGILFGSVPLLLLSLGFRSSSTTILLALAVVALQAVDSTLIRGWIGRRSVEIGLLVPWIVALIGYQVYGIGAAAYGLAFAIFGLAVLDQLEARNQERIGAAKRAAGARKAAKRATPAKPAAKKGAKAAATTRKAPAKRSG
jgi:predicted PurR-regulated permease PerM